MEYKKKVTHEYVFTGKELKKLLKIEGTVISIGLQNGRSPEEMEEGKDQDLNTYYIFTKEIDGGVNQD